MRRRGMSGITIVLLVWAVVVYAGPVQGEGNAVVADSATGAVLSISTDQEQQPPEGEAEEEHPEGEGEEEHPEGEAEEEHPEGEKKPEGEEEPPPPPPREPVTIEAVAQFLEGYVAEEAAMHDQWLRIHDSKTNKDLKLQLDKIHRERLSRTAEKTYFVCADFKSPEGKTFDLDFWVKETDDGLTVTETTVHKEEGTARYTWVEKDGTWSRKST